MARKIFVIVLVVIFSVNLLVGAENNQTEKDSFKPGQLWKDTEGNLIQAHGGGILYDEQEEKYYWYGEDRSYGYSPTPGVRVYSSYDLYNWQDEGLALTTIESKDKLENGSFLSEIYEGREDKEAIFESIGSSKVIERPKVLYNEETEKYVMWMHIDGPTETSDSNYAKAEAGVAVSDNPTGPFEFLESGRLNKMPEGYEYWHDNSGMARDMTLFKDNEGTAYIIYASEQNYSLYISKLNEDYTEIAGQEYGQDFIRALPGEHREAPAMFKYKEKYYLITSGSTGWAPNPAKYHVAESVLGEWETKGEISVGQGAATTFDSQPTYVIPFAPEEGKFIYMGDRWEEDNLEKSTYVWLPLEFTAENEIVLRWYDEWEKELLDKMSNPQQ